MQLYIKREIIRRCSAPALNHSRFGHRIKRRVHLDHFEMLCVPTEPFPSRHLLRIPALDKTGIRPTRRAHENLASFRANRTFPRHAIQGQQVVQKSNRAARKERQKSRSQYPEMENWLRGRSL